MQWGALLECVFYSLLQGEPKKNIGKGRGKVFFLGYPVCDSWSVSIAKCFQSAFYTTHNDIVICPGLGILRDDGRFVKIWYPFSLFPETMVVFVDVLAGYWMGRGCYWYERNAKCWAHN